MTGQRVAVIPSDNFRSLYLERSLNSFDTLTLQLDDTSSFVQHFVTDAIIEVWRKLPRSGSQWYIESTLLHRTPDRRFTEGQRRIFISYSRGLNDLLHRRHILYYANTAFTLKSGPGETVMKEFVDENAGPGASNALRRTTSYWTAPTLGLSVQVDQGLGTTWAGARAWKNLLDVLKEIAQITSVDFDVVRTGPRTFEFRTYYPQLGTDRSARVLFSPEYDNMIDVSYVKSRTEETNAILVLGQGQENSRATLPVLDATAIADSPWNVTESVQDARSQPTLTEMQSTGEEALQEGRAQEEFLFKVIQTPQRMYGYDGEYWFGDKVRAKYEDTNLIRKIIGVIINVIDGQETVDFTFAEYPLQ